MKTAKKTIVSAFSLIAVAGSAAAHEGHIAPMAGHSHGEILAVVVAAIALGAWALSRRA